MYEESDAKEHKRIGFIIPLLQYMNVNYNIICKNPTNCKLDCIQPLSLTDICNTLSYTLTNMTRLKKYLLSATVNGKPLICIMECLSKHMFVVNPYIFYKGSDIKSMNFLLNLFNNDDDENNKEEQNGQEVK